jgi:predicted lipoprotein with Yx(FWY)xxD motif
MRSLHKILPPVLALSLLASACGSSSSTSSASGSASSTPVVKTATNSKLGATILVNAGGLTLYRLSGEQNGKFICTTAACLGTWHPLTVPSGGALSGTVGSLGQVKRPDGTEQVTFKGMPLYTFSGDTAPGDANGQGFKDVGTWDALLSSGAAVASTPAASTSSSTSTKAYAY